MDKLYDTATYFENYLNKRRFIIIATNSKKKTIVLELLFDPSVFKHLSGLHKAKDTKISSIKSGVIYHQILEGKTTIDDISTSSSYVEIEKRLDSFKKIGDLIRSPDELIVSLNGRFGEGIGIQADYLLSRKDEQFSHLFLCKDNGIIRPVTFFVNSSDYYIKNEPNKWSVIEIIEFKEKSETKRKIIKKELQDLLSSKTDVSLPELKDSIHLFINKHF